MKKNKPIDLRNRFFSFLSAMIIGLNSIPIMSFVTAEAASSASSSGSVNFPQPDGVTTAESAKLNHNDSLVDNGDGTFTFTSKITSYYSYSDYSESRMKFKDGYYKLDKPGKYLIELWGGDGGDGGRALFSGRSGVGGSGGFVYGMLDVSGDMVGKYLVYEIGSKGESTTFDTQGGGTAGDGGGAGNITFVSIGAGGGYSAVYLSNDETIGDGEDKNVPSTGSTPIFRDDPQNVLMIAGGGGGGAAGANGFHLTALILKMHGDGGDGGSFDSSISGTPAMEPYFNNVGTYYAGENGTSSGGKTSYVGQGGTDRPEGLAKTTIGFMTASTYANDWQMTYHSDLGRGVGGAGNLHGGGGGAGFAGGGGGIQNIIVDANNVGGGGGGSSYVSNTISGFTAGIKPDDLNYFVDKDGNTNKETGGAIVIRYIPDSVDYSYLGDVTIEGTVSSNFVVDTDKSSVERTKTTSNDADLSYDNTTGKISFRGSIAPVSSGMTMGQEQDSLTLKLVLKPKDIFMGGNDVPIFTYDAEDMAFTCTSSAATGSKNCKFMTNDSTSGVYDADYSVSHVNVLFKHEIKTNSIVRKVGEAYTVTDLLPTQTLTGNDFISTIVQPTISGFEAHISKGYYTYTATASITPSSSGANSVGKANPNPTAITATASVQVIEGLQVDGFSVKAEKSLSYDKDNGTYDFDVDMNVSLNGANAKKLYSYPSISSQVVYDSAAGVTRSSLDPGIYYIEAWGGNGGQGGDMYDRSGILGFYSYSKKASGGVGGKGGFISGYIKISENKSLSISLGEKGDAGNSNYDGTTYKSGLENVGVGKGGTATYVWIGQNTFTDETASLIAGGGGGGGRPLDNGLVDLNVHTGYAGNDGKGEGRTGILDNASYYQDDYNGSDGTIIDNATFDNNSVPTYFAKGGNNKKGSDVYDSISDLLPQDYSKVLDLSMNNPTISRTINYVYALKGQLVGSGYYDKDSTIITNYKKTTKTGQNIIDFNGAGQVKITRLGIKACINDGSDTNYANNSAMSTALSGKQADFVGKLAKYLVDGFKITETFSSYFTVDSAEKLDSSEASLSVSGTEYTLSMVTSAAANKVVLSTSGTETSYQPISGYGYYVNKTTYTYTINDTRMGVRVHLKPADLLAGGNDIPLLNVLKVGDITDDTTYMNANKNSAVPPEVSIYHTGTTDADDDTDYIPRNNATDWANVAINPNALTVTANSTPVIVDYGGTITTIPGAASFDTEHTWTTDFVKTPTVTYSPTEAFTSDGICSVVGKLEPTAAAQKAVEIPSVEAVKKSAQIDVKLKYSVTKTLTNVSQDGDAKCLNNSLDNPQVSIDSSAELNTGVLGNIDKFILDEIHDAYVLTIKPDEGYDLPEEKTVKVYYGSDTTKEVKGADVAKKEVNISASSKEERLIITIPKSAFTNNITIEAEGVGQSEDTQHQVHYFYEVYDEVTHTNQVVMIDGDKYNRGDSINEAHSKISDYQTEAMTKCPSNDPNYDSYYWTCEGAASYDESAHTATMGTHEVYFIGRYMPKVYKLVITYALDAAYTEGVIPESDPSKTYGADFDEKIGDKTPYVSPDVTYYDEATDSYNIALTAGAEYNVRSPVIPGYEANIGYITGKVDEAFISEVTFTGDTYTDNNGNTYSAKKCNVSYSPASPLTIYKVKCDKYEMPIDSGTVVHSSTDALIKPSDDGDIVYENTPFSITKVNTANNAEETVDAIGESGIYYVYYKPEQTIVTVTFVCNDEGAIPASQQWKVVKDMEYGYNTKVVTDPDDEKPYTYNGMPRAVRAGYLFDGWYTAAVGGDLVEEDTIVTETENHTLYAHWKSADIKINVDYKYAYNINPENGVPEPRSEIPDAAFIGGASPRKYLTVAYGKEYTIGTETGNDVVVPETLSDATYTLKTAKIKKVALEETTEEVLYSNNGAELKATIEITVNVYSAAYKAENGNAPITGAHKLTGGEFALYDENDQRVGALKLNEKGTLTWDNIEANIQLGGTYTVKCDNPPTGYGGASQQFAIPSSSSVEVLPVEVNIFLGESQFKLPMAGGAPLRGYTICGVSTMLLAAFLLYLYVNKEAEEKENE